MSFVIDEADASCLQHGYRKNFTGYQVRAGLCDWERSTGLFLCETGEDDESIEGSGSSLGIALLDHTWYTGSHPWQHSIFAVATATGRRCTIYGSGGGVKGVKATMVWSRAIFHQLKTCQSVSAFTAKSTGEISGAVAFPADFSIGPHILAFLLWLQK